MMESKDVTARQGKVSKDTKPTEPATRPSVDIFEDATGITVKADIPGVSRERLGVHVDSDTLYIEGEALVAMPEDMQALYADVRSTRYERSFSLSSELDGDKIDANLKDGVLTLRIPKREEHKPRKIEVHTE